MPEIADKPLSELTTEDKAYIQWVTNKYMTAVDEYSTYLYSIDKAYYLAGMDLGISDALIRILWEDHYGMSAYNTIYALK